MGMQIKKKPVTNGVVDSYIPMSRQLPMPLHDKGSFERVLATIKDYVENGPAPKGDAIPPKAIAELLYPLSSQAKKDLYESSVILESSLFGNWLAELKKLNPKLKVESQNKLGDFETNPPSNQTFEPANYRETHRISSELCDKIMRIDLVRNQLREGLEYSNTHNFLSKLLAFTTITTSSLLEKEFEQLKEKVREFLDSGQVPTAWRPKTGWDLEEPRWLPDAVKRLSLEQAEELTTFVNRETVKAFANFCSEMERLIPDLKVASGEMYYIPSMDTFLWDKDISGKYRECVQEAISTNKKMIYFDLERYEGIMAPKNVLAEARRLYDDQYRRLYVSSYVLEHLRDRALEAGGNGVSSHATAAGLDVGYSVVMHKVSFILARSEKIQPQV